MEFAGKDDGEWWMSFHDFRQSFQEVTVCTLGPDFNLDGRADKMLIIHGEWVNGETAGGCRNDIKRFATNPQYQLNVLEPGVLTFFKTLSQFTYYF